MRVGLKVSPLSNISTHPSEQFHVSSTLDPVHAITGETFTSDELPYRLLASDD